MTQCKSPVSNALSLIGGKWKIAIIYNLRQDPVRFGELKRILSPITQQMLTKQLRELERDRLIDRKVYEVIPPKGGILTHRLWPVFDAGVGFPVQVEHRE
jgi:DNA-binding HxlR family transcriptional regulator